MAHRDKIVLKCFHRINSVLVVHHKHLLQKVEELAAIVLNEAFSSEDLKEDLKKKKQ